MEIWNPTLSLKTLLYCYFTGLVSEVLGIEEAGILCIGDRIPGNKEFRRLRTGDGYKAIQIRRYIAQFVQGISQYSPLPWLERDIGRPSVERRFNLLVFGPG